MNFIEFIPLILFLILFSVLMLASAIGVYFLFTMGHRRLEKRNKQYEDNELRNMLMRRLDNNKKIEERKAHHKKQIKP